MQFAYEILQATHASVVVEKGNQSWLLFTGLKPDAAMVIDAIGSTLNLIGANHLASPFKIGLYYHGEVK